MEVVFFSELNIFCAIILFIFAFKMITAVNSRDRRYFALVCFSEAAVFVFEALNKIFNGKPGCPSAIIYVLNGLFFILTMYASYIWLCLESIALRRRDFSTPVKIVLAIPTFLSIFLAVTAPISGWLFYVDEQHAYVRGPIFPYQVALSFGFILASSVYAVVLAFRRSNIHIRRKGIALSSYGIITLAAAFTNTLYPRMIILCVTVTLELMIMLFYLWKSLVSTDLNSLMAAINYTYPITVCVNITNAEYRFVNLNPSAAEMLATSGPYEDFLDYVTSDMPPMSKREFRQNFCCESLLDTYALSQRTKSLRYLSSGSDGNLHWNEAMSIFVDNTESNDILAVMLIKNIDEEMVKELQLREARKNAEAANDAKTTFLFNMSHDIRTPMNAILGFTSMAKKNLDDPVKVIDCLHKVEYSGNHLLKLINDILDMARIESGNAKFEAIPADIIDLCDNVAAMVSNSATTGGIRFKMEYRDISERYIYADTLRINQILLNILSNAIKYTNPGGTVTFTVKQITLRSENAAAYEFVIADNGIGMGPEYTSHIFDMFSRERTATVSGVEGTGLGMAITKQLIDMMHGTIDIKSTRGVGTIVTIRLSFKLRNPGDGIVEDEDDFNLNSLDKARILVVEDNELNREIAIELLQSVNADPDSAEDGEIALRKLTEHGTEYDAVLMDIQMPNMDGYTATKMIRKLPDPHVACIPIIAMTANAFEEDRQHALEAGMNGHLAKPINVETMMRTLCKIIGETKK